MSKKSFSKNKNTKRFTFSVSRNSTSHQAGANSVTITSKDYDVTSGKYASTSPAGTVVTMTVKEAQALNRFLNETLSREV